MFQSNKEYNDFLIQSGVHTFLQETPNKLLETQENQSKYPEKKDVKKFDEITGIADLIPIITNHESALKNKAKKLVLYDGNVNSNLMIIGEAPGQEEDEQGIPLWVGLVNFLIKCF